MKPKPTEAQIEKLGKCWTGHLSRGIHRDIVTHNLAYVYEKQFDVDVKFLHQEGRRYQPAGVEIDGKQFFTGIVYGELKMEHRKVHPYKPEHKLPLCVESLERLGNECVRLMNEGKDEELGELLWQYRDQYPDQIESFHDCPVEKPGEYRITAVALDGVLYKSDVVPSYIKDPFEMDVYIKGNTMQCHEPEKLILPTDEEIEKIGEAIANACTNHRKFILPASVMHYTQKYRFRYYRIFDWAEVRKNFDKPKVEHVLGIVINGRLFKTAHAPAEISDIDTLSDIRRQAECINGKRKLPENLVDVIGARWIRYLEAEGEERAHLDAVKDEYLHSYYYQYLIHSTESAVDYRHPTGIEVDICGKCFLTDRIQREMFRNFNIEEYCQNRILQKGKPKPSPEEIEELGRRYQYYMVATLDREEALRDALEYEFQFNTEARFLYPEDRAYWCGGPIAVEIEGKVFEADFETEFNDMIEEEKNPQEAVPYVHPKDRIEPTEEQVYELGMTYIEWVNEQSNRKRKKVLYRQLKKLENKYRVEMHEIERGHRTYEADAVLINRILFVSDKEDDFGVQYNVKWYCDEHDRADVAVKSDGSKKGCAPDDQLLSGMIFLRTKQDFSKNTDFEFEGRELKKYLGSASDVEIPEGVMIIGEETFTDNETVTRIQIPKTVYEINASAFRGCNSLREIIVEPENKVFDSRDNCNGIVLTEKNKLLVGCANTVIPETVESIGDNAYQYLNRVAEIRIPASVRYVTAKAFDGCYNLKRISVDEKNPVYDSRDNCNAIIRTESDELIVGCAATVIPDTVTALGADVFPQETKMSSITIPKNVTKLHSSKIFDIVFGEYTFDGIEHLKEIIVDKDNPVYDSREGCNAIIETASNKLIKGCMNTVIPKTVTAIGNEAFRNCRGLETVRIHSGIKEIGTCAFWHCDELTTVEFEDGITSIGMDVIAYCEQLKSVIFPDSVTNLEGGVLYNCKSLVSAVLPSKITELKMSFFYNCEQLKSIVIPDGVRDIGETVFAGCKNLTSVTFPKSLNHIGAHAFWNCESLTEVHLPDNVTWIEYGAFEGCSELKEVTLPEQLTTVSSRAFGDCQKLESIHVPANLEYVGGLFSHCDNLSKITVDPNNKMYDSRDDCNALIETRRNNLVLGCRTTVIPSSVREIGVAAFQGIDSLTSIEIPEGVVSISSLAFRYCRNLESVILPKSLERIEEYSFAECHKLKHVEIRNPKMYISPEAFRGSPYQPDYQE